MKNKLFSAVGLFAAAAMLTVALAGCAGGNQPGSSETSGESSAETTTGDYSYVKLGDYKAIEVEVSKTEITEEALDERVATGIKDAVKLTEVTDRAAATGDTVNVDYTGSVDGVEFEGGAAQATDIEIGRGGYIPGFEEGLIGMKTGEEKDVDVTFPDPYENNPDLAGAKAVFKMKVNSIKTKIIPAEITDEVIKELFDGQYETLSAYRDFKREEMQTEYDDQFENDRRNAIYTKLMEICTVDTADIPQAEIDNYVEMRKEDYMSYLTQQGQSQTNEEIDAFLGEHALQQENLPTMLIFLAIADKENLSVSDEEYQTFLEEEAANMQMSTEEAERLYGELFKLSLLQEKALDIIFDSATTVTLPSVTSE